MSTGRRAYDILRGWVNHEWDRIREIERDLAEDELRQSMDDPTVTRTVTREMTESEIAAAKEDARAHARKLLGLSEGASFEEIRKAFDRLNQRSDPAKYPNGSAEQKQAAEIQTRIHWAYTQLTDGIDNVEKRFRSLEIE
ncbi:MAG TPA: hypothetical protein PLX06_03095 [Fimbriimonadaceae bacterium]|nr:hypothetical protein [Fimbriimonadaceae bacterium]